MIAVFGCFAIFPSLSHRLRCDRHPSSRLGEPFQLPVHLKDLAEQRQVNQLREHRAGAGGFDRVAIEL